MEIGTRVKLISFNGESETPEGCEPEENYWALVGNTGTIAKPKNSNSRVLVQFDINVNSLGLHCHNEIPNSLLILTNDLRVN